MELSCWLSLSVTISEDSGLTLYKTDHNAWIKVSSIHIGLGTCGIDTAPTGF